VGLGGVAPKQLSRTAASACITSTDRWPEKENVQLELLSWQNLLREEGKKNFFEQNHFFGFFPTEKMKIRAQFSKNKFRRCPGESLNFLLFYFYGCAARKLQVYKSVCGFVFIKWKFSCFSLHISNDFRPTVAPSNIPLSKNFFKISHSKKL
jgi:hypothetical protein